VLFPWGCTAYSGHPLSKLNAIGLFTRKWTKLLMIILHGLVEGLCDPHCMTICLRVCSSAWLQGQLREEFGEKHCQYSPIGVEFQSQGYKQMMSTK